MKGFSHTIYLRSVGLTWPVTVLLAVAVAAERRLKKFVSALRCAAGNASRNRNMLQKGTCLHAARTKEAGESFVAHAAHSESVKRLQDNGQGQLPMYNGQWAMGVRIRPEKRKFCIVHCQNIGPPRLM